MAGEKKVVEDESDRSGEKSIVKKCGLIMNYLV